MKFMKLVALGAAALLACAPAASQNIATLPNAATLTGTEKLTAAQGAGCPTKIQPCAVVAVSPAQIGTYLTTNVLGAAAKQVYQEGSFTPVLLIAGSGDGITYATQVGRYTRVGRLVTVQINLILSSKGAGGGSATIAGLPFAAGTGLFGSGSLILDSASNVPVPSASVSAAGTTINLITYNGSQLGLIQAANLTNTSAFYLTISYSI